MAYGNSIISNSYSVGTIKGSNAGGFISDAFDAYIINSYASCNIIRDPRGDHAAFVIKLFRKVTNSYYNSEFNIYDNYAAGKSKQQLMQKSTFVGWDFDTVWAIDEGNSFPYLIAQSKSVVGPALNQITVDAVTGKTYDVTLVAHDITNFTGRVIILKYDSNVLQLVEINSFTRNNKISIGKIWGADVTITQISPGQIHFTVGKNIPQGKMWTGVINAFKFKSLKSQASVVSISVNAI
jgi:hypothetical protein